jgi:hypothetical protein
MTRIPDFDDRLSEWLDDGPAHAPARLLDTVLRAYPSIPQQRGSSHIRRRLPESSGLGRALVGIAAAAIIAIGGLLLTNGLSSNGVGAPTPATPEPSTSTSISPSASPLTGSVDTSAWTPFTSARYGVTVRYPTDWTATAATAPWLAGANPADSRDPHDPMLDTFTSPIGPTFAVASQPLPPGVSGAAWLASHEASGPVGDPSVCWPAPAEMERTTVDGLPAWIRTGCGSTEAIVFAGGRAYDLVAAVDPTLNRPLFDAFLSTVTFTPATADDTPLAPDRPSPTPS